MLRNCSLRVCSVSYYSFFFIDFARYNNFYFCCIFAFFTVSVLKFFKHRIPLLCVSGLASNHLFGCVCWLVLSCVCIFDRLGSLLWAFWISVLMVDFFAFFIQHYYYNKMTTYKIVWPRVYEKNAGHELWLWCNNLSQRYRISACLQLYTIYPHFLW